MASRAPATILLVLASLALLPVIYSTLALAVAPPPIALAVGLLSAGLAWAGGCAFEGRRRKTVLAIGAAGVAIGASMLAPIVLEHVGDASRYWGLACAALSLAALGFLARPQRT